MGYTCNYLVGITGNVTLMSNTLDATEGGIASFTCNTSVDPKDMSRVRVEWYNSGVRLSQSPKYSIKVKDDVCTGDICEEMTIHNLRVDDTGKIYF